MFGQFVAVFVKVSIPIQILLSIFDTDVEASVTNSLILSTKIVY